MATTVNNTTVNSRLTIIFDAAGSLDGDGPGIGTGNTESDVIIDNETHLNFRSHTEIDANIHALQWNAKTNTGEIEYIDNRENESISSLPQWATNVVIRVEAQNVWNESFNTSMKSDDADVQASSTTTANTKRDEYLTAHSITY